MLLFYIKRIYFYFAKYEMVYCDLMSYLSKFWPY